MEAKIAGMHAQNEKPKPKPSAKKMGASPFEVVQKEEKPLLKPSFKKKPKTKEQLEMEAKIAAAHSQSS